MFIEGGVQGARHPLVIAESSETGRAALRAGVECAQQNHGRLSVIYLLQPQYACLAGANPMGCALLPPQGLEDLETGEELLAAARAEVPSDIPVCTQLLTARRGHRKHVLAAAAALGCDAIIVPKSRRLFGLRTGLGAELARRTELPVSLISRPSQHSATASGLRLSEAAAPLQALA